MWKKIIACLVIIGLGVSAILIIKPLRHKVGTVVNSILPTAQALTINGLSAAGQATAPDPYIVQAVQKAMAADTTYNRSDGNVWVIESTIISADGSQAVAVLALVDPTTNSRLPIEPLTAAAELIKPAEGPDSGPVWQVFLPGQDGYLDLLKTLPQGMLDPSLASQLSATNPLVLATPKYPGELQATTTFGGYYLPWANGTTQYLSQGANHKTCLNPSDCTFAFDFYSNVGNGKFPIHAAKGGSIYAFYDSCPDWPENQPPNTNCMNYLVLQDRSTTPTTYQIYLHLSQNTIPAKFQTLGAIVRQGEWIGNADNTGASWGSHLHFMVVTNIYIGASPAGYAWGVSVDVTFRDVDINWDSATQGGRPCTPSDIGYGYCTQARYTYTSGNAVINPPTGQLTLPADHQLLTQPSLTVSGSGSGKLAITRLSMVANYDGSWKEVGPAQNSSPFTYDLDLCSAGIPDGPFKLALKVWDLSGNQSGLIGIRNLIKNVASCSNVSPPVQPPAACSDPSATQVVLYSGSNFTGDCTTLENGFSGSFTSLVPSVSSIKVGSAVKGMLYVWGSSGSRRETFTGSDRDLADNLVGDNEATWAAVSFLNSGLEDPVLLPVHGPSGAAPTAADSLILAWDHGLGANAFQARLFQGSVTDCSSAGYIRTLFWQYQTSWPLGNLPQGTFTWCVQGRFVSGSTTVLSHWKSTTFTVGAGSLPAGNQAGLPLNETVENGANGWTASGLWRLAGDPVVAGNHVWAFNNGLDYNTSYAANGDLTSPPISIPSGTTQYLRFAYYTQTEGKTPYWDQRWLQISMDGGAFQNILQLSDDAANTWLKSSFISLASYAGHNIRLRFHFDAIDTLNNNNLAGWFIDNIEINTTAPPTASACGESTTNNTPLTATAISIGQTISGSICPPGDVDYYKFQATKDTVLVFDVDARSLNPPSPLDSEISVYLSSDLRTVIASNNDQSGSSPSQDSFLPFVVPQTGTYYLRVKAHDSPGAGGLDYRYNLAVATDTSAPTVALTNPSPGMGLTLPSAMISASASDNAGNNGIDRVEFYWHSSDWAGSDWQLIGSDSDGSDGWQVPFDTSSLASGDIIAIYARAIDQTGNMAYSANWEVSIDPAVIMQPVPSATADTAVLLAWSVGTTVTNLDHFTIQYNQDGSGWQNWATLPGTMRQNWFVGAFGHTYGLRLSAVNTRGNTIQTIEASTTIAGTCQPDAYESADNAVVSAARLEMIVPQMHNFCGTGDVDWMTFNAEAGKEYNIFVRPTDGSAAGPSLSLYDDSGSTLLKKYNAVGLGQPAFFIWTAPASGAYALKVQSIDPAVAGTDVSYQIIVAENHKLIFPVVGR